MSEGPDRLDLGDDHGLVFSNYKGEPRVGCTIWHKRPDGEKCAGWLAFKGYAWAEQFKQGGQEITTWDVVQEEPLTLAPSVLCRTCGDHGFVRDGKWVRA